MILLPLLMALPGDVPTGFRPTDERAVFQRDADSLKAPDWMLTLVGDHLRAETRVAWFARPRNQASTVKTTPGAVPFALGMTKGTVVPSQGTAVEGGWLLAFDFGEFGGGIYFFAKAGGKPQKVSDDNTPLLVTTPKGLFAVQALTHLMFWYSRLVKVERGREGWSTHRITDLHVRPGAILWDRDRDRFLYATDEYVSTLDLEGAQHEIYRCPYRLRVVSMVRRKNGEVWIGSAWGLLRLAPKPNGDYAARWFVHA